MTAWILGGYFAGLALALTYVGAKGLAWGDGYGLPGSAWAAFVWPLAAPVVAGKELRAAAERRAGRRRIAERERQKWLEAGLP